MQNLRIEFPEGVEKEDIIEILKKNNFFGKDCWRKKIYIEVRIPLFVYVHVFLRKGDSGNYYISCHFDCRVNAGNDTRDLCIFPFNNATDRFIQKLCKRIRKSILQSMKIRWEMIKRNIEKGIKDEKNSKK